MPSTSDIPPSSDPTQVESARRRAADRLLSLRLEDGGWEGEVVWCPILPAQFVIVCRLTGREISEDRRQALLTQFRHTRHADGLWGMHPESQPYLFVTALVYVASRLLSVSADDELLKAARSFLTSDSGIVAIPSWGKFWLALLGLFGWKGVRPVLPELWLIPSAIPIHPSNYYCHTRLIYAPMAFLFGKKFAAPLSETLLSIRKELYPDGFDAVDFAKVSGLLRKEEVCSPVRKRLKFFYLLGKCAEAFPWKPLRNNAYSRILRLIRDDADTTDGRFLSPMSGLLGILALHVSGASESEVDTFFDRLEEWIFSDEQAGLRIAGARSMTWDTSFALQALGLDAPSAAREALAAEQILVVPPNIERQYRSCPLGGFSFGHATHGWPVSDCTAEALVALLHPEAKPVLSRERIALAIEFILERQNPDGGFGSYESRRTLGTLDWLNPAEMFGNSMVEHSWVECTASCLEAFEAAKPHLDSTTFLRSVIRRAADWLRRQQREDGSWFGGWGICFLYGTMFGIRGLLAAGAKPDDPELAAAGNWFLSKQHPDGSWGESHEAPYHERWIDGPSNCTQTAWALIGLQLLGDSRFQPAIERGIAYLVINLDENGDWPDERGVGVFFRSAVLDYRLYRHIFPLRALSLHRDSQLLQAK